MMLDSNVAQRVAQKAIRETAAELEKAYRASHHISGRLLTTEVNAIRELLSWKFRNCGLRLDELAVPAYEGGYGARDRDPEWPELLERAWRVTHFRCVGSEPLPLQRLAELGLTPKPVHIFCDAEDLAAVWMRSQEHEARMHASALGAEAA